MTRPDRRHLRRARLALAVVAVAGLTAWLWFPDGRAFLQHSLTALASLDPQYVKDFIAAWGRRRRWSLCANDPPGDRRPAAGLPDHPGERRAVRRLLGRHAVVVQRHGRGRALLLHRQSAGARDGGKLTGRTVLRSVDGYFARYGAQTIFGLPPAAVVLLIRSAMPPD